MPDQIFLMIQGQRTGPLNGNELLQLAQSGGLPRDSHCWFPGLPQWAPTPEAFPNLPFSPFEVGPQPPAQPGQAQPPQPPAAPPDSLSQPSTLMAVSNNPMELDIRQEGPFLQPCLRLQESQIRMDQSALLIAEGPLSLSLEGPPDPAQKGQRMLISGTGEVTLDPQAGACHLLELDGWEDWIFDRSSFLACDATLQLESLPLRIGDGATGGAPIPQLRASGKGRLLLATQGPVRERPMRESQLIVDGLSCLVARTSSVQIEVARLPRKAPGPKGARHLRFTLRGSGRVLLAPAPTLYHAIQREVASLQGILARIRTP